MKLFARKDWTDNELVTALRNGGKQRELATQFLLKKHINYVFKMHHQLNIEKEEARDAMVDALLAIIHKIESGTYVSSKASFTTFFYRIIYNKCVDFARKRSSNKIEFPEEIPQLEDESADILRVLEAKGDVRQLMALLQKIGNPCQQILLDWGAGGYNMTEIAERAGLKDAGRAKRQKYNCLQKLMKLVSETTTKHTK